jgi:hypothetical protein
MENTNVKSRHKIYTQQSGICSSDGIEKSSETHAKKKTGSDDDDDDDDDDTTEECAIFSKETSETHVQKEKLW